MVQIVQKDSEGVAIDFVLTFFNLNFQVCKVGKSNSLHS